MQAYLDSYRRSFNGLLTFLIALSLILSVLHQNGSQPVVFLILLLSLPLCFVKPVRLTRAQILWLVMLVAPLLVSIPLFISSGTGEALAAPARYIAAAICFVGLRHFKFSSRLIFRSASAAVILTIAIHPEQYSAMRANWGIGYIESGYLLIVLTSLSLAQLLIDWYRPVWRIVAIIAIVLSVMAAMWTGTRGAWPAIVIIFLLYIFLLDITRSKKAALFLVGVLIVFTATRFVPVISDRIDDTKTEIYAYFVENNHATSTGIRLDFWQVALESFAESPIWGVSYQRRSQIMESYIERFSSSRGIGTDGRHSSHNEILGALSQKGLLGLIAILLLYIIPLRFFIRHLKTDLSPELRYVSMAGIGVVLTMIFSGITEAPLMNLRVATAYGFFLVFLHHLITQLAEQPMEEKSD